MCRHAVWIALFAVLLSLLPAAGAHGHGATADFDGHADFCSTAGATDPAPGMPLPADGRQKACAHCDGCSGNAGNAWALPSRAAPTFARGTTPHAIDVATLPVALPADLIAAPPRGPPPLA
jgi:hypothetical protein